MREELAAYDESVMDGEIKMLMRLGRNRFGPPTPEIESGLKELQDPDRVERLGDAILTVKSWEELLETR